MEKQFNLFLICFIINIVFSNPEPLPFDVSINPNITNKAGFFIIDNTQQNYCKNWFPSLFLPILLIPYDLPIGDTLPLPELDFDLKIPFFNRNKVFQIEVFNKIQFLKNNFQSLLMKSEFVELNYCYLGIGHGIKNYTKLKEEDDILNILKNQSLYKIFSFDKWRITSELNTIFYLGDSHEDFNSNKGIIGSCNNYPENDLWGCSFKEMIFNNLNIPLKKSDESIYNIYIATETHNLIFPLIYKDIFKNVSKGLCSPTVENYLSCEGFFNNSTFVNLQLTESNENFVITGQVDSVNRFNQKDEEKINYARIQFEEIDYIILPLMVFKEFHVQFNAENNEIRFYTNNSNILKVKEMTKNNSSFGVIIFIILLIILIVLGICFGIFWLLRMGRNNEKSINKFSKFEDEEDYKNMNEKVF